MAIIKDQTYPYNLKKLVEQGYINYERSCADRRTVRVSLSKKGIRVARVLDTLYERQPGSIKSIGGIEHEAFTNMSKSLKRLETFWTNQILYCL